jgi:hypothetical protein
LRHTPSQDDSKPKSSPDRVVKEESDADVDIDSIEDVSSGLLSPVGTDFNTIRATEDTNGSPTTKKRTRGLPGSCARHKREHAKCPSDCPDRKMKL